MDKNVTLDHNNLGNARTTLSSDSLGREQLEKCMIKACRMGNTNRSVMPYPLVIPMVDFALLKSSMMPKAALPLL